MVSAQKRKSSKSSGSKKASQVSIRIRENIPFNKREVVTHTQVARKVGQCVITKSTKVVVPITPSKPSNLHPPLPSERDPSECDNPLPTTRQACKGPSHLVAVHLSLPFHPTCQYLQVFRQLWNGGFYTGMNLPTSSSDTKHFIWKLNTPTVRCVTPPIHCTIAWIASPMAHFV